MKDLIKSHFDENLTRVLNLVEIYEKRLAGVKQGRRPVGSTDILRASVVLLHATLEDFIRGILRWRLPHQGETALDAVPLVGAGSHRAEKFSLGRLVQHRSKTVDLLIRESVDASLTRSNFNNVAEISKALGSVSIDLTPCESFFSALTTMIERRHQIVHRADRNPRSGPGHQLASSIGRQHVYKWADATKQFFEAVYSQLPE